MGFIKYLNGHRRTAMKRLTQNIGKSNFKKKSSHLPIKIDMVLIIRANHRLGNLILITPLLEELIVTFPNSKIDILAKGGLAPIVFKNFKNVDTIITLPRKPFKALVKYISVWFSVRRKKYDLVINAVDGSSSGKLLTQFSKSEHKIFGDFDDDNQIKQDDYGHIAKSPIYNLRHYLNQIGSNKREQKIPSLNLKLSKEELNDAKKVLDSITKNNKKTICIFTFATGNKCYSNAWWSEFYGKLQKEFSAYNIIEVLPMENVSQIDFKAPTFYSMDIREIAALIANTEVFIGADSGIMHLASSSLTPTVGLFSVTKEKMYTPYNNNSIAINTNTIDFDKSIEMINKILLKKDEITSTL